MSRPLTVMQLLPELDSGGVERGTLEIAAALVAAGHHSLVVSHGGRLVPRLEAAGSRHITLPIHRKALSSLWQVRSLRHCIRQERPDIVHVRSRVPAWLTRFALRGLPPAERPLLVSTVHGFYSVNGYSAIMTQADAVIAVSDSIVQYIHSHYPRCPPERIHRIYRGINPDCYPHGYQPDSIWLKQVQAEFPALRDRLWLTLPGRLTRLKGHELFIDLIDGLLRQGYPVQGVIVGGAHARKQDYLQQLQLHIRQRGLQQRITFTGQRQDMREWLAASRLVFSLSRQPESFGRTTLEALALGTPVIGLDRGGVGEILQQVYPTGSLPVLPEAEQLPALISTVQQALASPVLVPVVTRFTLAQMTSQTLALYTTLVQAREGLVSGPGHARKLG